VFMDDLAANHVRRRVSRETFDRLKIIVAQLQKWQIRINLVSPHTMGVVWHRHIRDSLQLYAISPDAQRWLDIGSGGGFPGLVLAALLAEKPNGHMTLIESNAKKCAFLRETARLAKLPVVVINKRIETALPELADTYDAMTARALASLTDLLEFSKPLLDKNTLCLFPKGQDVDDEIAHATKSWNFAYDLIDSETDDAAKIMIVKSATRRV
jgi:16S rRNA (guanine527-N7)-methyltransferase